MSKRTALYDEHVAAGGKMVDFAGWKMPLNYGSQIAEHQVVRESAGIFDVSHMTVVDVAGAGARDFLRRLVANDIDKLAEIDRALYGALLNEEGGVIDDLIVYRRSQDYRCVVNASTRDKVLTWFTSNAGAGVEISERELSMVAVQGPRAIELVSAVSGLSDLDSLGVFACCHHQDWMIARTGYTGEDGVEVILPDSEVVAFWRELLDAGVQPAGLGARDTLRLEAGLNLYGQDMDETTSPLVSNMAWTVAFEPEERDFIGRSALEAERERGVEHRLTGLVLEEKGVVRHDQRVVTDCGDGVITSGIFSPTLGYSIALARVPKAAKGACQVEVRGKQKAARLVRPPFVRNGKRVHK
jgi:aminomethyltransferase